MKKIVGIIGAALLASSIFAVDFSATVKMNTTLAAKNGDAVDFLSVNHQDQKDGDALKISGSTDKAGASFQFWYTYDGTDGTASGAPIAPYKNNPLRIRSVSAWFKPIDMLKVTVGDVAMDSYKEKIFWWHGVYGAKPGSWGAFGGNYLAGVGAKVEVTPIDGLLVEAAIIPGIDQPFVSTAEDYGYKAYGLKAKYNFGPGSATLLFADSGKDAEKKIALGGDYASGGFSGFGNFTLRLAKSGDKYDIAGFAFDDYVKYGIDAFTVEAHLPFVMFKDGDKLVPGMYATIKCSYGIGAFVPYFLATTEPDGDAGWVLDDSFAFAMTFKPGVTFNVGSAAFDIAFRADVAKDTFNWSIPCGITVGL